MKKIEPIHELTATLCVDLLIEKKATIRSLIDYDKFYTKKAIQINVPDSKKALDALGMNDQNIQINLENIRMIDKAIREIISKTYPDLSEESIEKLVTQKEKENPILSIDIELGMKK